MKAIVRSAALMAMISLALAACGGGGSGGAVPPNPTPVPTTAPTSSPTSGVLQGCNATPSTTTAFALAPGAAIFGERRIAPRTASAVEYVPGQIAVTYDDAARAAQAGNVGGLHAVPIRHFTFARINRSTAILQVDPSQVNAAIAAFSGQPGVVKAERVPYRYAQSSTPSIPNDDYYTLQAYTVSATVPYTSYIGQWDMHAIRTANAWGYNQFGNGVKIAVIDTGADVTHEDLQSKIVRTECYVTINGTQQHNTDVSDLDGHGTNVAGIAAAATNNTVGFSGTGYNASLMIYKVFPNPPSTGCSPTSTNPACSSDSNDEISAINDAVANGANVINLSLGSTSPYTPEQNAIANALASGVVVVAAAGNSNAQSLDYPAAYSGVIAVGASAVNNTAPYSSNSPGEYVASYSNYNASNAQWGVVAPGGDPTSNDQNCTTSGCSDDMHWIENIYSSLATQPGSCAPDYGFPSSPKDCRILIAGTSQATPHVSGAVALLLGAGMPPNSAFNVLCSTADPINATPLVGSAKPAAAQGCGRLDLYRAMAKVVGDVDPGPGYGPPTP